jgi:hemerythrin superfamily protein
MNAIDLLRKDHKKVKAMLAELTHSRTRDERERSELLQQIARELELHTTVEEEIFYPEFRRAGGTAEDAKMFFEASEEHRAIRKLVLPDLQNTKTDSDQFSGRAKVLQELVLHHAKEEEKEMFARAKGLFDAEQLARLGDAIEKRKAELEARFTPPAHGRASDAETRGARVHAG